MDNPYKWRDAMYINKNYTNKTHWFWIEIVSIVECKNIIKINQIYLTSTLYLIKLRYFIHLIQPGRLSRAINNPANS